MRKDVDFDDDGNKVYTMGSIEDLKEEFCGWLEGVINGEGEKESSYKIENGKLKIKIEDTFITNPNDEGGKMTYHMVVENVYDEEQKVLN